ncbi:TIGR04283 family arsenosugar biosynthesis glycosyltransferase [Kinneretia asaccharophila]|uniref:RSAM/selenodomain-associated transferase 2 n=2 Tax=Roseateles asaccharophilus TaxID=582607 RepID=A0A4R6N2E1_9BURK|nr:TIGR04283 family arsenosugar biosynthesis glycosyltransferase [Roseateles asaccharophilus]MDN3544178.1 TIGR04283 family arsenosugar biosynthesis glycosyltransferase [Roseateles asaccharophilus]TDP09228.1 rSAM/selenodomain-associated transferase 2 [Roseateles asaccharophilus]
MRPPMKHLSFIIPVLNEAARLPALLAALQPLRERGVEIIVADGGSTDGSPELARPGADHVLVAPRGRARQMNAGAAQARGEALLFLHADTELPPEADRLLGAALQGGAHWGRFDVRIEGRSRWLPLVAFMMNRRSRWTGIATGDQAMFVRRELFERLGGFPDQPLMEDIELSQRLLAQGLRPACLRGPVRTSGRRWDERGALRTIVLMWVLRWRYWRGASAQSIWEAYR